MVNLGFDLDSTDSRTRRVLDDVDAPTSAPMREGSQGTGRDSIRRNPTTDEKKAKNRLRRQGSQAPEGVTQERWDAAEEHADLGVGHIWTNVQCPAYTTFDPADCNCQKSAQAMHRQAWDEDGFSDDYEDDMDFADPGGNSALRAEGPNNPRSLACPTCGRENALTPKDKALGYQCDRCADRDEGIMGYGSRKHQGDEVSKEAAILRAMADRSLSLSQMEALAAELEGIRGQRRDSRLAADEVDLADAVIRDHLTPILTHVRHTAATDWIGRTAVDESEDDDDPGWYYVDNGKETGPFTETEKEDMDRSGHGYSWTEKSTKADSGKKGFLDNAVMTEASLWFGRVSADVRADAEEFAEQAHGMARRVASFHPTRGELAYRTFLDRVAFLARRTVGSQEECSTCGHTSEHDRNGCTFLDCNCIQTSKTAKQAVDAWDKKPGSSSSTGNDVPDAVGAQDQSGFADSGLPGEPDANMDPWLSEDWEETGSAEVPSTRAPNVKGRKVAGNPYPVGTPNWFSWEDDLSQPGHQNRGGIPIHGPLSPEQQAWMDKGRKGSKTADADVNILGRRKTAGSKSARDLSVGDKISEGTVSKVDSTSNPGTVYVFVNGDNDPPAAVIYNHGDPVTVSDDTKTSIRHTADNCADCGAAIERDPAGEDPRTWHHNDGSSHDHEAKPGGGDEKKEGRRVAAAKTATDSTGHNPQPETDVGYPWKEGTQAQCKECGRKIEYFEYAWYHLNNSTTSLQRGEPSLRSIASRIKENWSRPDPRAVPYVHAMASLDTVHDTYAEGVDGRTIVSCFLTTAAAWKGEAAEAVKVQLRTMVGKTADTGYQVKFNGRGASEKGGTWTPAGSTIDEAKQAAVALVRSDPVESNSPSGIVLIKAPEGSVSVHEVSGAHIDGGQSYEKFYGSPMASLHEGAPEEQSGQGTSSLPMEPDSDGNRSMWPWEQDANTPGSDASNVAGVPSPDNGYPQPKGGSRAKKGSSSRYEVAKRVMNDGIFGADGTPVKLEGALLDLQTARLIVQAYEALNPENQARFDQVPLVKLVDMLWSRSSFPPVGGSKTAANDWGEGIVGKQPLGFPGAVITGVKPTADYLMNGPVGDGWYNSEEKRYVTTDFLVQVTLDDGRKIELSKSYSWLEKAKTQQVVGSKMAADDTCPYCGQYGCSPDCPGPSGGFGICPNCGGGAAIQNGKVMCDSCGEGYPVGSPFDTDPESAGNRRFTGNRTTAFRQAVQTNLSRMA